MAAFDIENVIASPSTRGDTAGKYRGPRQHRKFASDFSGCWGLRRSSCFRFAEQVNTREAVRLRDYAWRRLPALRILHSLAATSYRKSKTAATRQHQGRRSH